MDHEDIERIKAMQRASLIQDSGSYFQFEQEKLAMAEVQGPLTDVFSVDFKALEDSPMSLSLHELLQIPPEWLDEGCLDWAALSLPSEDLESSRNSFLDLLPNTSMYDNIQEQQHVPELPNGISSTENNKESTITNGKVDIQKAKDTQKGDSENLESWLDDLLG